MSLKSREENHSYRGPLVYTNEYIFSKIRPQKFEGEQGSVYLKVSKELLLLHYNLSLGGRDACL